VDEEQIANIKKAEVWLVAGASTALPEDSARTAFEAAYRDLAQLLAPVTAATLRATSDAPGDGRKVFPWAMKYEASEAKLWSRKLWVYTVITAAVILSSENTTRIITEFFPADQQTIGVGLTWRLISVILQSLEPFAYGALGSLAFLLRSAHTFIYERTFNVLRIPEYNSRILLGMISGGAIKLFIAGVPGDDGTVLELSAAALAFIAGYNSDFLFSTIERVSAAILPKVSVETVRRAEPDRVALMTVERLMARYEKASDAEKAMIEKLLERLTRSRGAQG
jgi:hypothetical protein